MKTQGPSEVLDIPRNLDRINGSLSSLEDIVSCLLDRLSPVSVNTPICNSACPEPNEGNVSVLGSRLDDVCQRINIARNRLADQLASLQI